MPAQETDAETETAVLRGQRRYLEGWHELTVKDQKRLVADGLTLIIYHRDSTSARWYGERTGEEGELVLPGERVKVFNAIVELRK